MTLNKAEIKWLESKVEEGIRQRKKFISDKTPASLLKQIAFEIMACRKLGRLLKELEK